MQRLLCTILAALLMSTAYAAPKKTRATAAPSGETPITAASWLVADSSGQLLGGVNTEAIRSIASITKLMTVMTVLDSGASLTETLPVKLHNRHVTRSELIDHAMIRSDNTAAKMLCDTHPEGYHRCIIEMNRKAQSLGMQHTLFTDPTGLLNSNVSTAQDLVKLVAAATAYAPIVAASNTPRIEVPGPKKSWWSNNTNSAVGRGMDFVVSKTGFIRDAGGCIVMMLHTTSGIRTVILLGSTHIGTRVTEALTLANRY